MQRRFEVLARSLANAWNAAGTIPLPDVDDAPHSRDEAFAIQERMAEILGDHCVGWKVGAAVAAVQRMEGHDGPIIGRLLAGRHHKSPAEVPATLFQGYKIECAFAFRFRDRVLARERPYVRSELKPALVLHCGSNSPATATRLRRADAKPRLMT